MATDKATPLNASAPLQCELQLSLLITQAGGLIRDCPVETRGELFARAIGALLRASDAPCLVSVLHAEDANADALADVTVGHA